MKLGTSTITTDESIRPDALAKALEERGFDSLVVAEHSHVPASRATPYPAGGDLPREYYRVHDPIVAVTAAAVATSELRIGTGVSLLAQRDTIQTAKEIASADHIANGRLQFGLGLAGTSKRSPTTASTPPRAASCSTRTGGDERTMDKEKAEFHGHFIDFDATFSLAQACPDAASTNLFRRIHRSNSAPGSSSPRWLDAHCRP